MKFIADLHIHSKYSRATSGQMNLEDLDAGADDKGILVMGTGDFTHPRWLNEIKTKLQPAEPGLFKLKKQYKKQTLKGTLAQTRFILSVEISSIYSQGGRVRRIHNIIFAPSIKAAEKLNNELTKLGCNLVSDGRPIIGLSSEKLAEIVFNIDSAHESMSGTSPENVIVPAHAWTPWFSIFGSMSGFDSIEECFGKYSDKIFAIETGLSSDPLMNWQVSKLDKVALISNSDSHSLPKIGREANIFDTELSYKGIWDAVKSGIPLNRKENKNPPNPPEINSGQALLERGDNANFVATVEFFPEEGKYHFDGHRTCGISWSPKETKKHKGICLVCGKPVTVGVMNRVRVLADRKIKLDPPVGGKGNYKKYDNLVPYYNLVGLDQIIGEALGVGSSSKKVKEEYKKMIMKFGSELNILSNVLEDDLRAGSNQRVFEGIKKMRDGNIKIKPGYDGEYGKVRIFD